MASLNPDTARAIGQVLSFYGSGQSTVGSVQSISVGEYLNAGVSAAQLSANLANLLAKNMPWGVGVLTSTAGLLVDSKAMFQDYTDTGTIKQSDIYSAASNLSSLVGTLALAGIVTLSAPVAIGIAVTATAASAILMGLAIASGNETIDLEKILTETYTSLKETFGEIYENAISDLADFFMEVDDFFSGMETALKDVLGDLWTGFLDLIEAIDMGVNNLFLRARNWTPPSDPLALDLDGDGIETVGISGSDTVLFDHDGDGIRTGTGWVKGDDGFLVLDRNGNGTIDGGGELFGTDAVKSDGKKAKSGLDALSDLDSNRDGVFDANDAAFSQAKIWQDANQDGISQTGELKSLSEHGIASISLTATSQNRNLGNGNSQGATVTFTRADGSTGAASDLNLADNPFYRAFADNSRSCCRNAFSHI